jgi:hypothetical protein
VDRSVICFVLARVNRIDASLSGTTMTSSQFVFPSLKNSDIILCLQELSIPFSEEDLQKPTPQRMQMVYEAFADILMGYTRESFDANVRACANEVENFVYSAVETR